LINYYRATIALRPEAAETHFSLGTALGRAGRFSEAIESLARAVALDPASDLAEFNLALCFWKARRFEEALEHARTAARINPKKFNAPLLAGLALKDLGDLAGALESYRRAMDLEPEGTPLRAEIEGSYAECEKERDAAAGTPASPSRVPPK
jgi:tetratricopeptide (TPR) repeat protein